MKVYVSFSATDLRRDPNPGLPGFAMYWAETQSEGINTRVIAK